MSKQVIVVRKDLNMSKGKMAAQVAHAAVGAMSNGNLQGNQAWLASGMKKVVVYVDNLEELCDLYYKVFFGEIPAFLVIDAARTEFTEPKVVCLGLGPADEELFQGLTNHLPLVAD